VCGYIQPKPKGHDTRSKDCSIYQKEAAALSLARKENIPITEAKKILLSGTTRRKSYAQAIESANATQQMTTPVEEIDDQVQRQFCSKLVHNKKNHTSRRSVLVLSSKPCYEMPKNNRYNTKILPRHI